MAWTLLASNHYLNQWWLIIKWTLGKKFLWNVYLNANTFIFLKLLCVKFRLFYLSLNVLTHWGRVTHICVSDLTSIGSDNGLSPGRRQAIIRTNAGILLIRPLGTNFSEFLVEILIFSFKKMRLKVSSAKWRPFCLSLNLLNSSHYS